MTARVRDARVTFLVIGPAVSWVPASGTMPSPLTSPCVGLKPTTPLMAAGQTMEPDVSVPIAMSTYPSATATAEPELEPQGVRVGSMAFRVWPPTPLQPELENSDRKLAHSLRFALPMSTAPAPRSDAANGASRPVRLYARAREPAVVGSSPASMLSFSRIGSPYRGPRARRWRSRDLAAGKAFGSIAITALYSSSMDSMRLMASATRDSATPTAGGS